ncbi:MAG TPA: NAD-dependent DNA ligase LigA [Planctomycetota bacterium]
MSKTTNEPSAKPAPQHFADPKAETEELARQLAYHDYLYWEKHAPEIKDADYDQLRERLKKLDPKHPQLEHLGERTRWKDALHPATTHAVPMLSIEKSFKADDVVKWATGAGAFARDSEDDGLTACFKIDGSSCALIYEDGHLLRAVTRGDGRTGNDITLNARRVIGIPVTVPAKVRFEIRGEIFLPLEAFEDCIARQNLDINKTNPRNLCAGTVLQNDPREVEKMQLQFMGHTAMQALPGSNGKSDLSNLNAMRALGFDTPLVKHVRSAEGIAQVIQEIDEKRDALPYETDGVVFTINRFALHQELGATSHHPRYRIAFKFGRQQGETTIREVLWVTSRSGRVCPAMQVEPIKLGGATVTACTLHNAKIVKERDVAKGDRVLLEREVIPHFVKKVSSGGDAMRLPDKCPSCGTELTWDATETNLLCGNLGGCGAQLQDYLEHYVSRGATNMLGVGEKLIAQFIAAGLVKSPADLYRITEEQIRGKLERQGETSAHNIVATIQAHREQTLEIFLVSLGVRGLGPSVASRLVAHFGKLDTILSATKEELLGVEGVAETMAALLHDGLQQRKDLIAELLQFIKVKEREKIEGPLTGKSFCLTGHVEFDYEGKHYDARPDIEELIKAKGGTIKSVSKTLDYLVVGDDPGSKVEKAKKANVSVISGQELLKLIG